MKHRRSSAIAVTTAIALSLQALDVQAYEADVHYGLTYWLARQQGLDEDEAHEIARGDQNADGGYLDAVHAMVAGVCLRGDTTASELVRRTHFRSQHAVPAAPQDRPVSSASPYAGTEVRARIDDEGTDWLDRLNEFGLALHGWQDAFSHQGTPASPPGCNAQWAWAHGRGGTYVPSWLSHDADLTHLYLADCRDAARTSYDYIGKLARKHKPSARGQPWSALEPEVRKFCAAATKSEKADWLAGHQVRQPDAIVKVIDLPDGKRDFGDAMDLDLSGKASSAKADREVDEVVRKVYGELGPVDSDAVDRLFEDFMRDWVSQSPREMNSVIKKYFAFGKQEFTRPEELGDRLLRARLRDHGLAIDPKIDMTTLLDRPMVGRGDWHGAFVRPRERKTPFLVVPSSDGRKDVSTVLAIFRHAPREVQVFTAQRQGDGVRITDWQTLAFP